MSRFNTYLENFKCLLQHTSSLGEQTLPGFLSVWKKTISQPAHVTACLHHQLWFCDAVRRGSTTQHPIPALVSHLPKLTINISSYYMATGRFPKTMLPIAQSKHFRECVQTEASNPEASTAANHREDGRHLK